jgi:hypothetical protein
VFIVDLIKPKQKGTISMNKRKRASSLPTIVLHAASSNGNSINNLNPKAHDDDDDDKDVKSSAPKRAKTTAPGWCVMITRYTDDYKPRGSDWSNVEYKGYFQHRERADECLRRKLIDLIEEEQCGNDEEDDDGDLQDKSLEELESLAEKYMPGEFVCKKFDWEREEIEFDDDKYTDYVPPPTTKKETKADESINPESDQDNETQE